MTPSAEEEVTGRLDMIKEHIAGISRRYQLSPRDMRQGFLLCEWIADLHWDDSLWRVILGREERRRSLEQQRQAQLSANDHARG